MDSNYDNCECCIHYDKAINDDPCCHCDPISQGPLSYWEGSCDDIEVEDQVYDNDSIIEGILDEAKRITDGDRSRDYDTPENNFARISNYWNVYLGHKKYYKGFGKLTLVPKDVAMMMILMKLAREDHKHKRDNLVDACGYARCAAKIEGDE